MSLAHGRRAQVPVQDDVVPIGVARIARPGTDATVVTFGSGVPLALAAATALAADGIETEVVDLRSLRPWDQACVLASVRRTGRLLTLHEAWVEGGIGAEIVSVVAEQALSSLRGPVIRLGAAPVPIPSGPLRAHALPNMARVEAALRRLVGE